MKMSAENCTDSGKPMGALQKFGVRQSKREAYHVPVAQLADAADLGSVICGFEFHREHSAIMANGSCVMKMAGRVGVGIERPTGSAAEGKKTVTRN